MTPGFGSPLKSGALDPASPGEATLTSLSRGQTAKIPHDALQFRLLHLLDVDFGSYTHKLGQLGTTLPAIRNPAQPSLSLR